ncbi:MAG: MFS transporter [Chloroflexi bacterium]|nr:MFS transporter [Chloroflexota bacterium]
MTSGDVSRLAHVPSYAGTVTSFTMVIFLASTSAFMPAPVLTELAQSFGTTVPVMGQLTAVTSLPWAIAAPLFGPVSDRYGRAPVLMYGLLALGLATVWSGLAWDLPSLFAARLVAGVAAAAAMPTTMTTVGDLFAGIQRARALGWVNSGFSIASLVGLPLIALAAGLVNWRLAFVIVGVCLLLLEFPVVRMLRHVHASKGDSGPRVGYAGLLRSPGTLALLGANVSERVLFGAVTTYLPALLVERYSISISAVAPLLSVIAIGSLAGNLVGGRLSGRLRTVHLFGICQLLAAVCAAFVFFGVPYLWLTALLAAALGCANAASRPTYLALVMAISGKARGTMIGMFSLTNHLGLTLGAMLGGFTISWAGYGAVAGLVLAAGAGAALISQGGEPRDRPAEPQ